MAQNALLDEFLAPSNTVDIAPAPMILRIHKSPAEPDLIRAGAAVADSGGYAIRDAIKVGVREIDVASRAAWEANGTAHEFGMSLLKPGVSCTKVTHAINDFFAERDLLQYRTFGFGHSFSVLSHCYGREARLELRSITHGVSNCGFLKCRASRR